jgi:type II secretory pathway component PulJ
MNKENGFTLAELLVSLMLLMMLMGLMFSSIRFSTRALDKNIEISQNIDDNLYSRAVLRKTLEQITLKKNKFTGGAKIMNFDMAPDQFSSEKRFFNVSIEEERQGENAVLLFKWDRKINNSNKRDQGSTRGRFIIMDNIQNFNFWYGVRDRRNILSWSDSFAGDAQGRLEFIKISIESDRFWPDLWVELKITHTNDCRYDPVSRHCMYR